MVCRFMCDWQVRTLLFDLFGLGALSQCPPLPVVVMTESGLSGIVHHVILFAGAGGREREGERERGGEEMTHGYQLEE